uniref:7TM GPCR serpentine receptor class x (Srx) domain-containing protein n=1 Tax=Romanomermis culicivorax TaxID=13658 RepID=A0A915HQG2_ROMCU
MRQIKSEIKVVYQSLLICLSSVTYIVVFFLPIEKNKLLTVIDHSIWICLSGTNSLILLTMNSTMKDQFRMVINKRRKPAVTVISTRIKD